LTVKKATEQLKTYQENTAFKIEKIHDRIETIEIKQLGESISRILKYKLPSIDV
jgi:hypothetical protein